MPKQILRVSVLAQRRPPVTRWGNAELRASAVLPQEPAVAPNTLLTSDGGLETWYLGGRDMVLYSGDTSHHKDNLLSGRPSVWVVIRGNDPSSAEVVDVTADPYEGEGYASDLDLTVEAVPMPVSMRKLVKDFVETHHVEIPFKKRKRTPVDPNAMSARAPRVLSEDDKWGKPPRKV
ncbi:MAG: Protein of unknown function (DUF3305) [Roseibaca calidilacus]|uniref:Molybdopterin-guanine dinucleotide biosynthesis protein A n=1 Tax=Roseibaca calidilacus TaxID=1666912 RepID=A0A0P8AEZ5_9RHOB|nr:DUF3305 domain-containing protein [Roseibaca calidilacus]KPP92821.1 MAG: Protein of unknown function (DUF3305) [Roseibaca calidilacus]CUX80107.1 Protein of unknown function (DUF3305) [Roseibaca calidilacus]